MSAAAPELELSADCIKNPTESDLLGIAYLMLFPGDEILRQKVRAADDLIDFEMRQPAENRPARYGKFLRVRKLPNFESQKNSAMQRGIHVGLTMLKVLIDESDHAGSASLSDVKTIMAKSLNETVKAVEQGPWRRYRPVAHMWAAFLDHNFDSQAGSLPCRPEELGDFLAIAEYFRHRAETTKLKQAPHPILPAGIAYRVRPGLKLPLVVSAKAG